METPPFASLAQLKVLLIPIGSIKRPNFEKWAGLIRSFDQIRLADIPPDPREDRARFLPSALSNGSIHLSYPSHPPPTTQTPYALFRPSTFCLGVIGIGDCSQSNSLASILAEFYAALAEIFGKNPIFPLAGRCYAFDPGDGQSDLDVGGALEGLVVIPTVVGDKSIYLGTLLANFCGSILGEFANLTRIMDTAPRIEELNRFLLPTLSQTVEDGDTPTLPIFSFPKQNGSREAVASLPRSPTFPVLAGNNSSTRQTGLGLGLPPLSRSPSPYPKRASTLSETSPVQGFKSRSASLAPALSLKRKSAAVTFNSANPRLAKITADFYLLSGRISDAIQWYNDSISSLKSNVDMIWQASAFEGLCTALVLEAWNRQDQPVAPIPAAGHDPPQEQWVDILEKLTQAVSLYWKAAPSAPDGTNLAEFELKAITTLYTEAVMRLTKFLFAIWSSKGWGSLAFSTMMLSTLPPTFIPLPPSDGQMHRMTAATSISRTQIANVASQAHGPFLLNMLPFDRIRVLSFLASTYSCLGFKRKEVYVVRELQAAIMELIISAREEASGSGAATAHSAITAFQGITPAVSEFGENKASGTVAVRENERVDGNDSLIRLVMYVCEVYGIDLSSVRVVHGRDSSVPDAEPDAEVDAVEGRYELFGWPELQVGVMREAIALAELLPDYPTVAQLALTTLRKLVRYITPTEQHQLYVVAARALSTARRRGDPRRLQYWAGNPLVSIEVAPLPLARTPFEHSVRDLEEGSAPERLLSTVLKDPFIYNPRLKAGGSGKIAAVQHETLEFVVTLKNTLSFDFDLQSVSLSTIGVAFRSQAVAVSVPANSFHVVKLSGVPLEVGTLTIRGCTVQASGCISRTFLLPLSTDEEETRRDKKRIAFEMDLELIKEVGLDALPVVRAGHRQSMFATKDVLSRESAPRYLECNIVPELPLMRVKRTSLTHGAVMLYDGETSTIRLTLENASALLIDFLRVTFEDSTLAPAQNVLTEGNLSLAEAYEAEYDLVSRPVFKWVKKSEPVDVQPGTSVTVNITCLGKVGCTSGSVQVAYARTHDESSAAPMERFYSRQILYPVLVTVYRTLECQSMDIIPFTPGQGGRVGGQDGADKARKQLLDVQEDVDWCLFTVDVRNVYGIPFEVTLERTQEGVSSASTTQVIPPGSTHRVILPLQRIFLSPEAVAEPIPSLLPRQFLVAKARLSSSEEKEQRSLFWYREELFKAVKASWKEPVSGRSGELSLRRQRLSMPMLEALRADRARIDISIETDGENGPKVHPEKSGKFAVPVNEFVYVKAKITNVHSQPAYMTLSLIPIPPTPMSYVLFEGSVTELPLGEVEHGGTVERELCLVFVAEGKFDWAATVKVVGEDEDAGRKEVCMMVEDLGR